MLIYPDANALHTDPLLVRKPATRVLDLLESADARLFVSPVVFAEIERHFLAQATESANEALSRLARLERWTGAATSEIRASLEETRNSTTSTWTARWKELCSSQIRIAPWPPTTSKQVVQREIQRRRPFMDTGRGTVGHRDAVIWEGLLELAHAEPEEDIVFITADKGFLGKAGLHDDLIADLEGAGIELDRVRVVGSLGSAIPLLVDESIAKDEERDERLSWRLAAASSAIDRMFRDLDIDLFVPTFDHRDGGYTDPPFDLRLPLDVERWEHVEVSDGPGEPDFTAPVPLGAAEATCTVDAILRLSGFMTKADWYAATGNDDIQLWSTDWDDQHVVIDIVRDLLIQIAVTFGEGDDDIDELEITGIELAGPVP